MFGAAGWLFSSKEKCLNAVPLSRVVETLERSFESQLAGHHRARSRVLGLVKRTVWQRSAGRPSALRLHLTGPSGVGKSFVTKLVATSFFEESASYTGYGRAAAAAATTTATTLAMASQAANTGAALSSATGGGVLSTALAAAPLAASGAALAAVVGWTIIEYGESFWAVEPRPYPTQCGVSWWKFVGSEADKEVSRALGNAFETIEKCGTHAVLVFEDINRLPASALHHLSVLSEPLLRRKNRSVSLQDVVVIFTSDLHHEDQPFVLEESMSYDEAEAVVEAQSKIMWDHPAEPPSWWTRDVVTIPLPPLDDVDLDAAIALYLHNDVPTVIRDALRFEFNQGAQGQSSFASYYYKYFSSRKQQQQQWTGTVAFDQAVVENVRDFVRQGPEDWRCHAITHFHTTVVEPRIDQALNTILSDSDTTHQQHQHGTITYTSSLLMRLEPRVVNVGSPLERRLFDAMWQVVTLAPRS